MGSSQKSRLNALLPSFLSQRRWVPKADGHAAVERANLLDESLYSSTQFCDAYEKICTEGVGAARLLLLILPHQLAPRIVRDRPVFYGRRLPSAQVGSEERRFQPYLLPIDRFGRIAG